MTWRDSNLDLVVVCLAGIASIARIGRIAVVEVLVDGLENQNC